MLFIASLLKVSGGIATGVGCLDRCDLRAKSAEAKDHMAEKTDKSMK
jgi:hypothetical protein